MSAPEVFEAICGVLADRVERSTSWFPMRVELGAGNFPAGLIVWAESDNQYGETFDPTHTVFLDVELRVRGELLTAHKVMTDYVWPGSGSCIYDALATDHTLSGLVTDVAVTGFQLDAYVNADEDYVGRVHLRVML